MENTISLMEIVSDHVKFLNFKNSEDALLCLNSLLSKDNSNDVVNILLFRGMIHYSLDSFNDALNDFNKILDINPDNVFAIICRGTTYRMLFNYVEALKDLDKSLEMKPDSAFALAHRGSTYERMLEYNLAISDFNRSVEIKPSSFALTCRGVTYMRMEKYDLALSDFNRSLEITPDDVYVLRHRGESYSMLKKYDDALLDINRSLEINPNDAHSLTERGLVYMSLEKYDEALSAFNSSLKINPDDVYTLRSREEIYQMMRFNLKDIWEESEIDEIEKIERISAFGGNYIDAVNKLICLIKDQDAMTDKEKKQLDEIRYNLENSSQSEYGYCKECQHHNTGVDWCNSCNTIKFQKEFCKWTSEVPDIDNFIQLTQIRANNYEEVIEWIPFDRFKDINYVGRGGFGVISKAIWIDGYIKQWDIKNKEWIRNSETNVILKKLDNSTNAIKEFLQEVKNQYKFRGKWVIATYGITKDPVKNDYMMVLQYASGGSLREMLNNHFKDLDWNNKLDILRYISYELALIHKEGLMHKDFHSGNLVGELMVNYNYDYITYITDFGLCRPIGVQDSKTYGVLQYIAPEVLNDKYYTQASDIYSFGVIMTEILTGYPPYHDFPHDADLALLICQGLRPKIRCEIPQLLLDMINRCLNAEPSKRPSAKKLYRILQKCSIDYKDPESEFSKQVKNLTKEFPMYDSTKPIATNSKAIYTSRPLDYKRLPRAVNITQAESQLLYDSKIGDLRIPDE